MTGNTRTVLSPVRNNMTRMARTTVAERKRERERERERERKRELTMNSVATTVMISFDE